jgi:hypothetical protein
MTSRLQHSKIKLPVTREAQEDIKKFYGYNKPTLCILYSRSVSIYDNKYNINCTYCFYVNDVRSSWQGDLPFIYFTYKIDKNKTWKTIFDHNRRMEYECWEVEKVDRNVKYNQVNDNNHVMFSFKNHDVTVVYTPHNNSTCSLNYLWYQKWSLMIKVDD